MGVTIKYPASGTPTASVSLPYPAHEQSVTSGTRQDVGRTHSGTPFVASHGGRHYRIIRRFESLSETEAYDLLNFLHTVGYAAGEVCYEYVDHSDGSTVKSFCRIVYPTSETKLMRHVRDVTIVFEQYVHPDHVTDVDSTEIGTYGGGTVGSGTPASPKITSSLYAVATQGSAFSYTITAEGSSLTFSASGLPGWLTRSGAVLSGTPGSGDVGPDEITIAATNGSGSDSKILNLVVDWIPATIDDTQAPIFGGPDTGDCLEQIPFEIPLTVSGSRPIAFTSGDKPAWVTIDSATGTISGTPPDEPGSPTATFTIDAENDYGTDSLAFTLTIAESTPPTITSAAEVTVLPGDVAYHALTATGSSPIEWTVDEGDLPSWASLHPTGSVIAIEPNESLSPPIQSASVDVDADNGAGTDSQIIVLRTGIPAEILTIGDTTQDVAVGDSAVISFTYRGTDAVVSLVDAPAWATLAAASGSGTITLEPESLAWRVGGVNVNPFVFTLSVDNAADGGAEDTETITITVTEPPVIYSSGSDLSTPYTGPTVSRTMQYYTMGSTNSVGLDSDPGTGEGVFWSRSTGAGPPPIQTLNLHPTGIGEVGDYDFVWYAENEYGHTTQNIRLKIT